MAQERTSQSLSFKDWKERLRKDCLDQGKLFAFDALGEFVLNLWWETGTAPTVNAILEAHPSDTNK